MIKVDKLSLSLKAKLILDDMSFDLPDRKSLIVLGRSGSGKTVLIKTIIGLFKPDRGSVMVDGVDMLKSPSKQVQEVKNKFAIVFQNAALLDSFTVFQNVALPLYERRELSDAEIRNRVVKSLDVVGLANVLDTYPSELSGGMRKRVGIARALVYEPKYIIFDEPISGLDPITAKEILFYISQIIEAREITTITITHDIKSLERVGDMTLFIENGKKRYFGELSAFFKSDDPLIKEFVS
jgi:phospholipid/cholesterol/gamma-HCH transport system ATP-binding protein